MPSDPDPALVQRNTQAGLELYDLIYQSLKTDRGVHLETALAAAGYLAGYAILKSSGINLTSLPPGAPVFIDQVNDIGPQVIQYLQDLVARGRQSGSESLTAPPADSVPPDHASPRTYEDLFKLLAFRFDDLVTRHSIPPNWIPYTCTVPAARLIIDGQAQLAPSISKAIVIQSMVSASKTVPPHAAPGPREINNREQFFRVLAETTTEIDGFAIRQPDYPVWLQLRQQLHAMQEWSANNAQPTSEQLQRVSIGLIAARELEPAVNEEMDDLVTRLHLLNHYWRNWAGPGKRTAVVVPRAPIRKLALLLLLTIAGGLALAAAAFWGLRIKSPYGTPVSPSVRTPAHIATLISTLEPYMVSLHRDPANDRYRVSLFLHPIDGSSSGRLIPIASGMRVADLRFGARMLGNDGSNLWFFVNGVGALNYATEKIITAADLRRMNPSLTHLPGVDNSNDPLLSPEVRKFKAPPADLWADDSRRYSFGQRLQVTAPDFRRTFEVDPATLKASPCENVRNPQPDAPPERFLTAGGLLWPTEWIGIHTPAEAARDFKPGSNQAAYTSVQKTRELRRIYTGRVQPDPGGGRLISRIMTLDRLAGTGEYLNAALISAGRETGPMVFNHPDGFAITYTSKPGLDSTLMVARLDKNGKAVWTADTGIGTLQQILPDSRNLVFTGVRPHVEGRVSEPVLVIIHTESGRMSTSTLWK